MYGLDIYIRHRGLIGFYNQFSYGGNTMALINGDDRVDKGRMVRPAF